MRRMWPVAVLMLLWCGSGRALAATAEETKLWRVAQAAFQDGIYDLVERQCREFLTKYPASDQAPDVQLMLGQSLVKQGKWAEATKVLKDGQARWPEKQADDYLFWLAEALVGAANFVDAEQRYTELIERYPRSNYRLLAHYGLAYVEFKRKALPASLEALDRLATLGPKGDLAREAALLRGQVLLAQLKLDQAEAAFEDVIRKFPSTLAAYQAHYWRGESRSRQSRYDDALKEYGVVTQAFAAKPTKPGDPPVPVTAGLAAEAWLGTGWAHWHGEQYDEAANAFAQAFANATSDAMKRAAMLKLGESYVRAGKLREGVAKLKAFLESRPTDPIADEVQMTIGDLFYQAEDYAGALAEYTALVEKYPQSKLAPKASFNAAGCAYKLGVKTSDQNQLADALKFFQQAFELAKDKAGTLAQEALFKLADVYFALGQYPDAITNYQRLISSYPTAKLLDRAMFQLNLAYQRTRNPDAAIATLDSLVEQFPSSPFAPEALFQIGQIHAGQGQHEQARQAFTKVATRFPNTEWKDRATIAIGDSFFREGRNDEAIAEFDKLIATAPESPLGQRAFYNRGWCYFQRGQGEKTLADFTEFLKKYPSSPVAPEVQFWIADYYVRQKDYLKAQEQFQLIAGTYRTNALADSALYMAARAAYTRQDFKGSIELYESLLKTYATSTWRCDARFGQGDALSELGQFDDALLVFDSLLKDFPDCPLRCEAMGRKGDALYALGRFEEAVVTYRAALTCAVKADPALRNQVRYKIGQSFDKLGKLEDAFAEYSSVVYEMAVAAPVTMPLERFWLSKAGMAAGDIKERQQQWKEAIKIYERLMELCPDLKPVLEERIRKLRVEHFILF